MHFRFEWPSRSDWIDSARLAVQSAAAAAGAAVAVGATAPEERFVGVLSAVLVVQPSLGNTLAQAIERIFATLVGTLLGLGCLLLLPGSYGTVAALTVTMLVINGVAGLRPQWRYGVVAAVALALGPESNALETAEARGIAIGIGAGVGIVAALLVWPERATSRTNRMLREALGHAADHLDAAVDAALGNEDTDATTSPRRAFQKRLEAAREALDGVRIADSDRLEERVHWADHLNNSVLFLKRVAEQEDDREGRSDGFDERVREVRERACTTLRALADGESPDEESSDVANEVEDVREHGRSEGRDGEWDATLVFGLDEVQSSLRHLVEAFRDDDESKSES